MRERRTDVLSSYSRYFALVVVTLLACGCSDKGATGGADVQASADAADTNADIVAPDAAPDADHGRWPPYGVAYDPFAQGIDVPACAEYGDFGPYRVGVRHLQLGGEDAEVWYPVDRDFDDDEQWDFYDMRDWLPDDERDKIGDDDAPLFVTRAVRDEPLAAEAIFPIVVFSHGMAAYRYQSSFLTTHLASWGYVVASTDHPSRTLKSILERDFQRDNSAEQLRNLVDGLVALDGADGEFAGRLDTERVAVSGHSAGARTSGDVIGDERFDTAIFYAGSGDADATEGKPVYVLGADADGVIPEATIREFFDEIPANARYAMIAGAGHLAFSDICLIARDEGGVLSYARQQGVDVPQLFDELGTDGCGDDFVAPEETWPMINHTSVAFLRHVFEQDADPVVLEPAELDHCFGELVGDTDVK